MKLPVSISHLTEQSLSFNGVQFGIIGFHLCEET